MTEEREEIEGVPKMWCVICGGCGRVVKSTNTENAMRTKLNVAIAALELIQRNCDLDASLDAGNALKEIRGELT